MASTDRPASPCPSHRLTGKASRADSWRGHVLSAKEENEPCGSPVPEQRAARTHTPPGTPAVRIYNQGS